MVIKKAKKTEKKTTKKTEEGEGMSLDDAFGDDEDVEYAKPKPVKIKKKNLEDDEDIDDLVNNAVGVINKMQDGGVREPPKVNGSKPVGKLKKGDKMKIDGVEVEVDAHYELIDHGTTKEIAIEVFDKNDHDYQIRYFDDQVESTIEVYELQDIMYLRKSVKSVSW